MWVYKRVLRISWTEHRTHESVDDLPCAQSRHISRRNGTIENLIVKGKIEENRPRGRSSKIFGLELLELAADEGLKVHFENMPLTSFWMKAITQYPDHLSDIVLKNFFLSSPHISVGLAFQPSVTHGCFNAYISS